MVKSGTKYLVWIGKIAHENEPNVISMTKKVLNADINKTKIKPSHLFDQ